MSLEGNDISACSGVPCLDIVAPVRGELLSVGAIGDKVTALGMLRVSARISSTSVGIEDPDADRSLARREPQIRRCNLFPIGAACQARAIGLRQWKVTVLRVRGQIPKFDCLVRTRGDETSSTGRERGGKYRAAVAARVPLVPVPFGCPTP